MSFFNFRRGGSAAKSSAPAAPAESVETVRKHARQRLIGAAVLVLLGVIGFPLIFDTQPRPVAVDIPIEIPSRTASKPLAQPPAGSVASVAPAATPAVAAAAPALPTPSVAPLAPVAPAAPVVAPAAPSVPATSMVPPATSLQAKEEIVPPPAKPAVAEVKPAPKVEPKPAPKIEAKPEPKAEAKADAKAAEAQRAKALLEGKTPVATATSAENRLVVQVGAFADANKARDARLKLEKAGLKTYTQVADTKDGKRIRVRVGPYASKAEADKAAAKIKTLDLPASVLAL